MDKEETQQTNTCSMSIIGTLQKGVNYVQTNNKFGVFIVYFEPVS